MNLKQYMIKQINMDQIKMNFNTLVILKNKMKKDSKKTIKNMTIIKISLQNNF